MKKEMIAKVQAQGIVDTKNYRYMYEADNAHECIKRLPIDDLDTTAALDSWEIVWENK